DGNGKYFEVLFGTPLHLDFQKAIEMYGGTYRQVKTETSLKEVLTNSYQESGLSVIEVKTDRTENMKWHRKLWHAIKHEIKVKKNSNEESGIDVIEVKTERTENMKWHRKLWHDINEEILENEGRLWSL